MGILPDERPKQLAPPSLERMLTWGPMPGCGMHSRPKLAEKARYNSLLKIKQTTTTTTYRYVLLNNHQLITISKIFVANGAH